ncbi:MULTISPECIES: hypothetical protein [unclassified Rhizobium]|uniref:hypothetical protein n=1 Tax=unclassified Rhizobium TaxID=2613769 RepID=UPI001495E02A|nr:MULTISPECIES: hypothetical protein [unclassified Rhizobium]
MFEPKLFFEMAAGISASNRRAATIFHRSREEARIFWQRYQFAIGSAAKID